MSILFYVIETKFLQYCHIQDNVRNPRVFLEPMLVFFKIVHFKDHIIAKSKKTITC